MALTYRSAKGSALTITELDNNFRYFTGFDSYFWESPTRPWFLIIPNNKYPNKRGWTHTSVETARLSSKSILFPAALLQKIDTTCIYIYFDRIYKSRID